MNVILVLLTVAGSAIAGCREGYTEGTGCSCLRVAEPQPRVKDKL